MKVWSPTAGIVAQLRFDGPPQVLARLGEVPDECPPPTWQALANVDDWRDLPNAQGESEGFAALAAEHALVRAVDLCVASLAELSGELTSRLVEAIEESLSGGVPPTELQDRLLVAPVRRRQVIPRLTELALHLGEKNL